MGCGTSHKQISGPIRLKTVTGQIKITVSSAHIIHETSMFKMDPYIILKLSNQTFQTKVAKNADKQPSFNQSFQFFINSCFKVHGRNLQMLVMDKKKIGSDSQVGFGIVDLDPVINFKKPRQQFRCFIGHGCQNAGHINIVAEFRQQPSQTLSFRFQTASIRRKTGFGDMQCRVRVTIGEQILKTSLQKDTKQAPPVWKDEMLTFNLTKSIQNCNIQILNKDEVIGNLVMTTKQLLGTNSQQSFNEQFQYQNKVNAGTIKFQTLIGDSPKFSQIKIKKPQEKKKTNQQQNPEKKQDKKEQGQKQKKEDQPSDKKDLKVQDMEAS